MLQAHVSVIHVPAMRLKDTVVLPSTCTCGVHGHNRLCFDCRYHRWLGQWVLLLVTVHGLTYCKPYSLCSWHPRWHMHSWISFVRMLAYQIVFETCPV